MQNISEQYFNQVRSTLGKLDQALGCINESILWLDKNGIIEWSNNVFNELAQRIRIEILGKNINEMISVSFNNKNTPLFMIIKKVVISGKNEVVVLTKSDQSRFLEVSAKETIAYDSKPYFIVVLHDVTEREQLLNNLMQKDNKLTGLTNYLNGIIESMPNMLIVTSPNLDITFVNQSTIETLGYVSAELIGQSLQSIVSDADDTGDIQQGLVVIQNLIQSCGVVNQEMFYKMKTGEKIPVLFSSTVLKDGANEVSGIVCVAQDISQLRKAKEEIIYLASHDALTALPNRSEFEKVLNREVVRSKRHNKEIALLFIDLDNFKHINDSLGHHVGDEVLMEVSKRIRISHRQEDMIARLNIQNHFIGRLGGDEFVVLLTDIRQTYDAGIYAKRLASIISAPIKINDYDLHVTASIGIAIFPTAGTTGSLLIKNADIAMYRAKEKGRNRVEFYTKSLSHIYEKCLAIENGLYKALENGYLYLEYQPQYNLHTNRIRGLEVLIRWKDPEMGQVEPSDFIPIAEKSGLIIPVGNWVLREACRQLHHWQTEGIIQEDLIISINVSPYQLIKDTFVDVLRTILKETNVRPHNLELEITETALMTQSEGSEVVLSDIKNLGISISIDDFGTGYSSLTRIKELPINTLKIDKSFIHQLSKNKNDSVIVKSIIAMAKALELSVIAEGVETKNQAEYLLKSRCELVQGFHLSKPLPVNKISKLLKKFSKVE